MTKTYRVSAVCNNCGYCGGLEFDCGKRVAHRACPRCECLTFWPRPSLLGARGLARAGEGGMKWWKKSRSA